MKYLVIVPDGCADRPLSSLEGKTPLEAANIKYINELARISKVGMVRTIPEGIAPGSDAANLSIMGYDPCLYLTGRASLEAAGLGVTLEESDVAFRVNLITAAGNGAYEDMLIKDHSAGEISTEEAKILIDCIDNEFADENSCFYPSVSYRCLLVTGRYPVSICLTPPHDVLNQKIGPHLPKGDGAEEVIKFLSRSYEILKDHPLNKKREQNGLNPANSLWLWGQGTKPDLPSFAEKYGLSGSIISAVDLIKGIGVCAGLSVIPIPGADGTLHTNYEGKALAAINEFKRGQEFVYVHIEAPDECAHNGDLEGKIKSLELIDSKIVRPLTNYLENSGEPYSILILPDHRTPVEIRTHSTEPVPFILYNSTHRQSSDPERVFSESAGERGDFFPSGCALADFFFRKT